MAVRAEGTGRWPEFREKPIFSSNLEKNLVYMAAVALSRGLPWFRSWFSGWFSVRVPISARFVCSRSWTLRGANYVAHASGTSRTDKLTCA